MDSELRDRAVSSNNLSDRYQGNQTFGKHDFSAWSKSLIDGLQFTRVLDICCGTGNQLVLYAAKPGVKDIWGVDLSQESLDRASERIKDTAADVHLVCSNIDEFFDTLEKDATFDLISCFYGLYYSEDTPKLLGKMQEHLDKDGRILIVGPYGKNNYNLFEIIERYSPIPEAVVWGSNHYMEKEVFPCLEASCIVEQKEFVNEIEYPGAGDVIKYWQASTFYSAVHEKEVAKDLEKEFAENGTFIVEKHVKAYIAKKK